MVSAGLKVSPSKYLRLGVQQVRPGEKLSASQERLPETGKQVRETETAGKGLLFHGKRVREGGQTGGGTEIAAGNNSEGGWSFKPAF
jgi:hypothetical protein